MAAEELAAIGRELFGGWGWQTRMAKALRVDKSTVRRWATAAVPVPGPAAVALRCLLRAKRGELTEAP